MTGVLTSQDVGAPKLPLRLSAEVRQIKEGNPIIGPSMVVTNRHMRDVLMVKAHQVHYGEFNGGQECLIWRGSYTDGLLCWLSK
jgi:enterochelin esterase-like enzyme